jgi:Flp pilus assembly protein TadB
VASSQQLPHRASGAARAEPVLITEAELSQSEQHAARKKRYVITMAIRGVSLVMAAVTYQTVWLMIIFAVLGTVLPWIAVVMANDRPPKKRQDVNRNTAPRPDRILESGPAHRVIDM